MPDPKLSWLAPGACRHVAKLLAALSPQAPTLTPKLGALLTDQGFPREAVEKLLIITPAAASRARTLDAFFPTVERSGHELAALRITPEQATEALRNLDPLLDTALQNRFQPA